MFGGRSSSSSAAKTTAKEAATPAPTTAGDAAASAVGAPSQQQQQFPPAPVYGQQASPAAPVYSELPPAPIYGSTNDAYGTNSYVGVPPPLPPLPPPSMSASSVRSGPPAWLWVGLGIILATIYQKVTGFVKGGGAQQAAANMMMQQMMKQAAKQGGGAPGGGFPGFPPPGGMPPGFGFPPPPPPGGAASPFGPGAFDTTATSASGPGAGSKFEAVKAREEAARAAAAAAAGGPTSTSTSSPSSSPSAADSAKKSSSSAFKDVTDEPSPLGSGSSSLGGNGASTSSSGGAGEGSGSGGGGEAPPQKKISSELLDGFFRDPSIQQMFYQHLPEEMRNPETFEWILSNPENRAQLEAMVEAQAGNLDPNAFAGGLGNAGDMTAKLAVRALFFVLYRKGWGGERRGERKVGPRKKERKRKNSPFFPPSLFLTPKKPTTGARSDPGGHDGENHEGARARRRDAEAQGDASHHGKQETNSFQIFFFSLFFFSTCDDDEEHFFNKKL